MFITKNKLSSSWNLGLIHSRAAAVFFFSGWQFKHWGELSCSGLVCYGAPVRRFRCPVPISDRCLTWFLWYLNNWKASSSPFRYFFDIFSPPLRESLISTVIESKCILRSAVLRTGKGHLVHRVHSQTTIEKCADKVWIRPLHTWHFMHSATQWNNRSAASLQPRWKMRLEMRTVEPSKVLS